MHTPRVISFVANEIKEALPAVIVGAIGFNLIERTTQLLLNQYLIRFTNYTLAALLLGKPVLAADALPFLRRFDTEPLDQPILVKPFIYRLMVALFRFLERAIEYLTGGGRLRDIPGFGLTHFGWSRFAVVPDMGPRLIPDLRDSDRIRCAIWRR
jgi:hypothetical protein